MKMISLVVGPLETNCYILYENGKCLIVDPGAEENNIIKRIEKLKVEPIAILLTHNHFDHSGASVNLKSFYKIPIYDYKNLKEGLFEIEDFSFDVIYTPGHSNTEITYYFEDYNFMLCGDFVFKDGIGRTDLPGGSFPDMVQSIKKLKTYDKDIKLYPGHGEYTTIAHELKHNKYFI